MSSTPSAVNVMSDVFFIDAADLDANSGQRTIDIVASIPGRYTLTRQIDANGNRREFSGRVVRISPDAMTLAVPVKGAVGERVIATLWEFGRLEGPIVKTDQSGFVMGINLTVAEREKFAAKIEWYDRHKNQGLPDKRKAKRIVPQHPHSSIILADGRVVGAFVIDVSVSGAAVSADVDLEIGEPIAVGRIVGRVVRHFAGGFAVRFIDTQNPHMLEKSLRMPETP